MLPILNPPPTSLPIPSLWVIPVHQPEASSIMHRTWTGNSFHIRYYTCFNAILPNYPTLSLSHRVQKTVLYICVSFCCLAYRVIVTMEFRKMVIFTFKISKNRAMFVRNSKVYTMQTRAKKKNMA